MANCHSFFYICKKNMDVDLFFDKVILNNEPLTDYGRELIINKLIVLKNNILEENPTQKNKEKSSLINKEILSNLSDNDLVVLLVLGYEYFAVKYFINLGKK
jgi:hypothetical protein